MTPDQTTPRGDLTVFWIFWGLNLLLAGWQLVRAWFRPREVTGFATVVSLMWLYFYVFMPCQLVVNFRDAFTSRLFALAELTPLVALTAFLGGWHWGLFSQCRPLGNGPAPQPNYGRLWWAGVSLILFGWSAWKLFMQSGREFETTSAYWYLLITVVYPGMSIGVAVLARSPRHRTVINVLLLVGLIGIVILPFLVGARRGPLFVTIIAVGISWFMVRPRPPQPGLVLGVFVVAGALILFVYSARRAVYAEETWRDFFRTVTVDEVVFERANRTGDNEFFNHCLALEANLRTGLYQYGTGHLAMLVHWVPRAWWPGKPERGRGFFPSALLAIETEEHHNVGYGGSIACVADTFDNYGYFFPFFWLALGWLTARFFAKTQMTDDVRWKLHYVGLLCASHWFVAQNFTEAFVPFCFFQAAYFVAFRFARVTPERAVRSFRPRESPVAQKS